MRLCEENAKKIRERKEYWLEQLKNLSDESFQKIVCENSNENFICYRFMNEKYFLGYTDEKPAIKVNDLQITFSMECPRWNKNFCICKKEAEKEKKNFEEEEQEW